MLPEEFCQRMHGQLGAEANAFFAAMEKAPRRAFRFDPKKVSPALLTQEWGEGEAVPFCPHARYFSGEGIGHHPLHHGGALYVQEPAAMAPVASVPPRTYDKILDLCASPGGKSLQAAAQHLSPDGILIANEPDPRRRKVLMQNVERMGEKRILVTGFDATELPTPFAGCFDLVICDAPCSGEGMMRKDENAVSQWSPQHVADCAALQQRILQSAVKALNESGVLLYSTCTWSVEENEAQVLSVLEENPDLSLLSPPEAVCAVSREGVALEGREELKLTRRFYPHLFEGEGQYLAVFSRKGERKDGLSFSRKKKKEIPPKPSREEGVVAEFLAEVLGEKPPMTLFSRGEDWYLAPLHPFPAELFSSPGVLVGRVQKGRVIPHHRFFLAFASDFCQTVTVEKEEAERYLAGQEIPTPQVKGWAAVYYGNCPLGGVKASGGVGKNYYPKGLRKEG